MSGSSLSISSGTKSSLPTLMPSVFSFPMNQNLDLFLFPIRSLKGCPGSMIIDISDFEEVIPKRADNPEASSMTSSSFAKLQEDREEKAAVKDDFLDCDFAG